MSFVTFEEIENLPNQAQTLLIDVREPGEITDLGEIPTSINIPLGSLEESLELPADISEKRWGRRKPVNDTELIFTCKSGRRATIAAEAAIGLGFGNVKIYQGSWMEWAARKGL